MFIVDTQVHIWKEETPDRPWVPGARERIRLNGHREEAFTYEECLEHTWAVSSTRNSPPW